MEIVGRLTRALPLSRSNELPVHVARAPGGYAWTGNSGGFTTTSVIGQGETDR